MDFNKLYRRHMIVISLVGVVLALVGAFTIPVVPNFPDFRDEFTRELVNQFYESGLIEHRVVGPNVFRVVDAMFMREPLLAYVFPEWWFSPLEVVLLKVTVQSANEKDWRALVAEL